MSDGQETERVAVRTYVPAYQKETWREHADDLGMSQAEFVRTMVQAGRRGFDLDDGSVESGDGASPDVDPRGNALKDRVLSVLAAEGHKDWDALVDGLTDDLEARLDDALAELQQENRIRYSGRHGGYTVVDDGS